MPKKKSLWCFSLFLLFWITQGYAQAIRDTPPQYTFNQIAINPAYAGRLVVSSLDVSYLGGGQDFDLLNRTVDASWHGPLDFDAKNNLSFQFKTVNEVGVSEIRFKPGYAFRMPVSNGQIGIGGSLGINFFFIDQNNVNFFYDPFFTVNFSIGAFFYNEKFYAGLSAINLTEQLLTEERNIAGLFLRRENPYYFTGGFIQRIGEYIELRPSVLVSYSDAYQLSSEINSLGDEWSYDITAAVIIDRRYWVTAFFGHSDFAEVTAFPNQGNNKFNRFGIALHTVFDKVRLGYGIHRTTIPELGTEFPISHLVTVGYDIGLERAPFFRYF